MLWSKIIKKNFENIIKNTKEELHKWGSTSFPKREDAGTLRYQFVCMGNPLKDLHEGKRQVWELSAK